MSSQTDRFRVLRRLPEIRFEEELRGYSKNQVDRVLETLAPMADEVEELQRRLAEAETRAASAEARLVERGDAAPPPPVAPATPTAPAAEPVSAPQQTPADFDETLRNTLLLAQRTADATVKEANDEAERVRAAASTEAEELLATRRQEADKLQSDNEADRKKLAEEVKDERARLLADAKREVDSKLEAVEAELVDAHEGKRTALLEEIAELQAVRDVLATDVENFEGHLTARRESIRDALADISDVLDDPARLRAAMPPTRSDAAAIDPGDYPPITVDVPGLADLDPVVGSDESVTDLQVDDVAPSDPLATDLESDALPAGDADASGIVLGEYDQAVAPAPDAAGPATEAIAAVPDETEADGAVIVPPSLGAITDEHPVVSAPITETDGPIDSAGDGARPAWADAVPSVDEGEEPAAPTTDPFLDELRRVTTDGESSDEDDEALARFLENEQADGKSGWFGRRR